MGFTHFLQPSNPIFIATGIELPVQDSAQRPAAVWIQNRLTQTETMKLFWQQQRLLGNCWPRYPHPSDGPDSFLPATWSDSWSWGRKLAVGTLQRQCWWQLAAYCRAEPRRSPPALSGSVHCRPVPHAPPAQRHGSPSLKENSPEQAQKQKPRMPMQQQQQKEEAQARAANCGDGGKELCDRSNGRTTTTTKPCFVCRIMNKIDRIIGWKFQRLSNGWN